MLAWIVRETGSGCDRIKDAVFHRVLGQTVLSGQDLRTAGEDSAGKNLSVWMDSSDRWPTAGRLGVDNLVGAFAIHTVHRAYYPPHLFFLSFIILEGSKG